MTKATWTVVGLKRFEQEVKELFEQGKIHAPVHLSGGNEEELMRIFKKIKPVDYVFSTHRNHYHYLLKGGSARELLDEILGAPTGMCRGNGRSMNVLAPSINFYSSAIVGGNCAIAVGVGLSLKKKKSRAKVWCFIGDGAEDTGHFVEAARFAFARRLPVTFVIEDNDFSTDSTKVDRWHNYPPVNIPNVIRYQYKRIYPHVGVGKHVTF